MTTSITRTCGTSRRARKHPRSAAETAESSSLATCVHRPGSARTSAWKRTACFKSAPQNWDFAGHTCTSFTSSIQKINRIRNTNKEATRIKKHACMYAPKRHALIAELPCSVSNIVTESHSFCHLCMHIHTAYIDIGSRNLLTQAVFIKGFPGWRGATPLGSGHLPCSGQMLARVILSPHLQALCHCVSDTSAQCHASPHSYLVYLCAVH